MDAQNQSHYRKAGRSGGVPTKGGGGGGGSSYAPTDPANLSFKYNNYASVPQPGGGTGDVDSGNSSAVQNVAHQQLPTQRVPEAAAVSKTSYNLKPTDASTLMTTRPGPKSPSSNVTNAGSEAKAEASHGKGVAGVLRNPRAQSPQYAGGILSGRMQSVGPQGGMHQNNDVDSDRWRQGTAFQKGLAPYPQTPMPMMHKAEKKYEVGKVSNEEEAKQRQLKAILNKLTPQNFGKLGKQVKQMNIDNVITLSGLISQIFDKALMEPTFCEMYANFCYQLAIDLPPLSVDNKSISFKRLLLNKCQEEFEREEREEEEANKAEEKGEVKQSAEEREEKRLRARRCMLGSIRLIGELYKKRMLTERIMHHCINKMLGQYQNPDEEKIEALCKLMSTIGEMIDNPNAKEHMDAYFDVMAQLSNNMKLSSRVRFMLKDAIDLRKNKWQQRRRVEGPKKIEEVHRDAAQERQAQSSRLGRAPSMGNSPRGGPPSVTHNVSSDKVWPEEQLRDKSLAAIKEFYSARDEKEVALCIKDLNAPSFYPSMISIWVTDSFERKDVERDVLTKLLINLSKPQDRTISEDQLVKGFESVLEVLEDAVNDAPRAAEFLGRMFAKIILENVVSLSNIGKLVREGGEEKGRLVEVGIAAEVLGSIFDIIESEKGESVLNEIRSSSNLRVEDFRPVGSSKKSRIDKYITT